MEEFDLDRATEIGWAGFQSQLADHLAVTREPLSVMPFGGDPSSSPVLEVAPTGEDETLHAELRAADGSTWPEDDRSRHMTALGWSVDPGRTTYVTEMPRSHAHLLAAIVTDTLREVVGVPHPAFLDAGVLTPRPPAEDEQEPTPVPQLDVDTAVPVRTPQQLRELVDTTLHVLLGHPPRHDADGDVPILFGSALVYVRTADAQPVVTIFSIPVQDIGDLTAARREVAILNRSSVFAKFHLVGRQVVASVSIPCLPFVPRHLFGMVQMMGRDIDRLDEDLAVRVGGRRWIDLVSGAGSLRPPGTEELEAAVQGGPPTSARGTEGDLPPELRTVLDMSADGAPPLDPAAVAEVCHHDPALLLRLIRVAEEQTISWRTSVGTARTAGDPDEVRAATQEMRAWRSTVRDLRAALRHVVTFGPEEGGDGAEDR
ncbi:T3SS (YopN, CesT) and YbjN peptide-binding chaperone 1 [Ornithinimicrobium avium]|uniref:Uncharacterized protein n=1 Tax=Ornithinimicrobium avium TaxID=2283195 RepID=A0A345NK42_9MICO|nr:hypothetical protein [Ornithinimicrobium avium]AXH95400.1 hypothetical protein DV701_04005 [Ornithinimicrobium avium]